MLDVSVITWGVPVPDTAHLVCIGVYTLIVNDMTQAVYAGCIELAFGPFKVEEVGPQPIKDYLEMPFMLLNSVQEAEYVIQVYMHKPTDDVSKYGHHQPLKSRRGITIPLLHNMTNIGARYCGEGCLVDILGMNTDLLICIRQVYLGPEFCMSYIFSITSWSSKGVTSFTMLSLCWRASMTIWSLVSFF
jgi:hypothetical protein